jgi:hypothetical protein
MQEQQQGHDQWQQRRGQWREQTQEQQGRKKVQHQRQQQEWQEQRRENKRPRTRGSGKEREGFVSARSLLEKHGAADDNKGSVTGWGMEQQQPFRPPRKASDNK